MPKLTFHPIRGYLQSPVMPISFLALTAIFHFSGLTGTPMRVLLVVVWLHVVAMAIYNWQSYKELKETLKRADDEIAAWQRLSKPPSDT